MIICEKYNISRILFGCFIFLFPLWEREYIAAEYHVVPICMLYGLIIAGFQITTRKKVSITATDILMFSCGLYLWLHYMNGEIHSVSHAIYLMYFGLLYAIGRGLSSEDKIIGVYAIMAAGMLQAVIVWLQYLHISSSHHVWFDCTGSYSNPALCAAMIALSLIAGMYIAVKNNIPKNYKRIMMFLYLPFIVSALILTNSRASWLAVGVSGVWMFMDKKAWSIRRKWTTGILLLLVIVPSLYLYRPQSANSRLFIWRVCTEIIKENPITGNGPQAVQRYYMPYQARLLDKETNIDLKTQATDNTYSFNEYLRILCEYGWVGLLLFIGLIGSLRKDTVFGYLLSVLLVVAFFSYPSSALSLASLFMLFVGASASKPLYSFTVRHRLVWGTMGIMALWLLPYVWLYKKTDVALGEYFWSVEQETFLDKNYKYFRHETELVSRYAKVLFYAEEYEKAIPVLERLTALSPTSEIYVDLGLSCQHTGRLEEAQKYYEQAAKLVPGYMTPQYRLFRLYLEQGKKERAQEKGNHIINMPLKLESSKTKRMKEEVFKILGTELR